MPRKKPTLGENILDAQDQKYQAEVVAAATKKPDAPKTVKNQVAQASNGERRQQIRANAPATSKLAYALRDWHNGLEPDIKRLASTSSKFSAFIEDHDEELTSMFKKYIL